MTDSPAILNEREARDAKATVAEIDRALSSEQVLEAIVAGLPPEVVDRYRHALALQRADLEAQLDAYEAAKGGDYSQLKRCVGDDPGVALIVARIAHGYSQRELARRLGLKEQQIQRYEADRYRSISLSNYRKIAHVLGVGWEMKLSDGAISWPGSRWEASTEINASVVRKIIKHAKDKHWFDDDQARLDEDDSDNYLRRYITDHIINYGTPTLLRTGLNVERRVDDLMLLAWKSRVTRIAEQIIQNNKISDRGLHITWLRDLVHLSTYDDGPARARKLLVDQGIFLVAEPQIPGLQLDGAAFLLGDTPVIGMTLRRDTIDNFWFTLLHEIAHVILHSKIDLRSGFFDDIDNPNVDELEKEANDFASNLLISNERWLRSPARIAKSADTIENLAKELGVHPAIVFGRVQKERRDYAIFADKIGRGSVRKWLVGQQ
jgi:HTH-type transcriptional regulator/antitoxin HigA